MPRAQELFTTLQRDAKLLYESMQDELNAIVRTPMEPIFRFEACYETALRFWLRLQFKMIALGFASINEEIDFFKNVKPLFISEIEYYHLLCYLQVFMPQCRVQARNFLQQERSRLPEFLHLNHSFCHYYRSGRTDCDDIFFCRTTNKVTDSIQLKPYVEPELCTGYDQLVSGLVALERYDHYLQTLF